MTIIKHVVGAACVAALAWAAPARANTGDAAGPDLPEAGQGFDLSGELGVVSDYRFRGVSLSDREPAVQGGLYLGYGALSVGAWTSTIAETAGGWKQEVDLSASFTQGIGGVEVTATALAYLYPGDEDASYYEFFLDGAREIGPVSVGVGVAYAPEQPHLDSDNLYLSLAGTWSTPVADVTATIGHEDGSFAPGGKWDWSLGVARAFGPIEASLAYVGADQDYLNDRGRNLSGDTLVAGLKVVF
jgi:uncharacterized protein (TIGR02001 family)